MTDNTGIPQVEFDAGGQALFTAITDMHELDAPQMVQLIEACRTKDRLDRLDALLRGDEVEFARVTIPERGVSTLMVNGALDKANSTANVLKQLIAALRLPDANGKRSNASFTPRGAHKPSVSSGGMSSLERAMARKHSA